MSSIDIKAYGASLAKSILGEIPFVGAFIGDVIFELIHEKKDKRIETFLKDFANFLEEKEIVSLETENINKDDFGDILEDILISVSKTSALHKKEIFKKILFNQFRVNESFDNTQKYIGITNIISEKQFEIVSNLSKIDEVSYDNFAKILDLKSKISEVRKIYQKEAQMRNQGYANSFNSSVKQLNKLEIELQDKERIINKIKENYKPDKYNISEKIYLIEIQDLISKGLLTDIGVLKQQYKPFEIVKVTELCRGYIEYILIP